GRLPVHRSKLLAQEGKMGGKDSGRRAFIKRLVASPVALPGIAAVDRGPLSGSAGQAITPPKKVPGHAINVLDFGAVGDGHKPCTASIQAAIDACADAGGGKVVVPPGRYVTGPIFLKSNLELEVLAGATLLGITNFADYPTIH